MSKELKVIESSTEVAIGDKTIRLSNNLLKAWYDTYPKEFLELEIKKARNWLLANPHKAPKSQWGRFFNGWLDRGWENYRKTLKSNPVKLTLEDMEEILKG